MHREASSSLASSGADADVIGFGLEGSGRRDMRCADARAVGAALARRRVAASVTVLLGIAAAMRCLVFVLYEHRLDDHMWSDMGVYELRAQHMLEGRYDGWDTFTPPGYPAMLALVYWLFGHGRGIVGVAQAAMGGGIVACAHRISLKLYGSLPALAVGILCVLHFPLMYYSGFMLSEVTFEFLLLAWLLTAIRFTQRHEQWSLVAAGCVLGASIAVRPNALGIMVLAPIWLLITSRCRWRVAARWTALFAVGALPLVALASWHNSRILGRPSGVATNGGLNFYLNVSDVGLIHYRRGREVDTIAPLPNLARYHEAEWTTHPFYEDGYFYGEGLRKIERHPVLLLRAFENFPEAAGLGKQTYWPPWQGHERFERMIVRAFFWWGLLPGIAYSAYLVASRRVFRREHGGELVIILCLGALAVTIWLFLGDPRVRVPFDPLFIMLGVGGVSRVAAWLGRTRAAPSRALSPSSPRAG